MSASQIQNKNIIILYIPGDVDSSLENTAISLSKSSLESEFTDSRRDNSIRSSSDLLQSFKDWDWYEMFSLQLSFIIHCLSSSR